MRNPRKQLETGANKSEPHFDEEWTVLSARPVVPLAEIESKEKRRSSMRLVGAFVLASSLGALVALTTIRMRELSARHSEGNQRQETVAATAIDGDSAPVDVVTTQTNEESSTASTSDATDENPVVVTSRTVSVTQRKHQTVNVDLDDNRSEEESTEGSVGAEPQPKLVDQWQEVRPRRVREQRPRNDGGAHHPRDLRDLDEIFEGSPKKP